MKGKIRGILGIRGESLIFNAGVQGCHFPHSMKKAWLGIHCQWWWLWGISTVSAGDDDGSQNIEFCNRMGAWIQGSKCKTWKDGA